MFPSVIVMFMMENVRCAFMLAKVRGVVCVGEGKRVLSAKIRCNICISKGKRPCNCRQG